MNKQEEITRLEETFDELTASVSELSGDDLNSLSGEGAYTNAADRVRTLALKAAHEYRERGEPVPQHVASAMFFMPIEPGTESLISTVDSTNDDRGVKSRLDDTEELVSRMRLPEMHDSQASVERNKNWTLMFFFASDNPLSPSVLPQLKAIKAAGSQADTNVLVYFDPNETDTPSRIFQINKGGEQTPESDGSSGDPVFSALWSDYINPEEIRKRGTQSKAFADSLRPRNDKLQADTALEHFLGFCGEAYPAEHYMLFLVGHGLVVGRDAFLPDDNPESAIGLRTLGKILNAFKNRVGGALELIGMDSCSMSAVEVAYELKGTAKYMLASQGLSFVGPWPYRHLLTKIYHDVGKGDVAVSELVKSLHTLCFKYSVDFMDAGYSSDLCLCSLDRDNVEALTEPISRLSYVLRNGLAEPRFRDDIVLAHWRSQSYWQETYTDLYDFCLSLSRLCQEPRNEQSGDTNARNRRAYDVNRVAIIDACAGVMNTLNPENSRRGNGPVVCADYVGPDVQYSHGLSIYFPWSQPLREDNDHVINNYQDYAFTSTLGPQAWLRFLDTYFEKTRRPDRIAEEERANSPNPDFCDPEYRRLLAIARKAFPEQVVAGSGDFFPTSVLEGKITPPDNGGGACTYASTKNYSRVFSMSPGVASVFDESKSSDDCFARTSF